MPRRWPTSPARFVASRGPVTDHDFARWAGITLGDARDGLRNAPELATRELDGASYWLAAGAGRCPGAPRRPSARLSCSPDSTSSCWATRIAPRSSTPRTPAGSCPGPTASSADGRGRRADRRHLDAQRPCQGARDRAPSPSCSAPGSSRPLREGRRGALPRVPRTARVRHAGRGHVGDAHRDRPVHARPARPRPACARGRGGGAPSAWCRCSFSTATVLARFGAPNRLAFLLDALGDLDASLRERGARSSCAEATPWTRRCAWRGEAGADAVFLSEDVSAYAQRARASPARACDAARVTLHVLPGVTRRPARRPGAGRGDLYRVFTPYWRRWRARRRGEPPCARRGGSRCRRGRARQLPALADLVRGAPSPELPRGASPKDAGA